MGEVATSISGSFTGIRATSDAMRIGTNGATQEPVPWHGTDELDRSHGIFPGVGRWLDFLPAAAGPAARFPLTVPPVIPAMPISAIATELAATPPPGAKTHALPSIAIESCMASTPRTSASWRNCRMILVRYFEPQDGSNGQSRRSHSNSRPRA